MGCELSVPQAWKVHLILVSGLVSPLEITWTYPVRITPKWCSSVELMGMHLTQYPRFHPHLPHPDLLPYVLIHLVND